MTFSGGHKFDWERSDNWFSAAAAQSAVAAAVPAALGCPEASDFLLGVFHLKDPYHEQLFGLNLQDAVSTAELDAWLSEIFGAVQRNALQMHLFLADGQRK